MPESKKRLFTARLLSWYAEAGRHDLPWQKEDWYSRIVSEVMLQQTQVVTVLPRYLAFMEAFPTPQKLAQASEDEVMALWAGLGYYSRARNLQKAVRRIVVDLNGECPSTAEGLAELPGIGPSTAGAVAAFVFRERAVMADGNAQRVLSRVFTVPGNSTETRFREEIWALASDLLPSSEDMADYTQALMDLGALVCRRKPDCRCCPVSVICGAAAEGHPDAYPGKKPRRERPVRHAAALFAFDGESVWLEKREKNGVWKGLWAVPVLEGDDDADGSVITARFGLRNEDVLRTAVLDAVIHDFTHYRLILRPVMADLRRGTVLAGTGRSVAPDEAEMLGMPTPLRKLLESCRQLRTVLPRLQIRDSGDS